MYNVAWNAPLGHAVLALKDFQVIHVAELKFKTPLEGQPGFAIIHRGTGVRMFEGVDISYAVRKTIAEQLLLNSIKSDPELGVDHPPEAGSAVDPFASLMGPVN